MLVPVMCLLLSADWMGPKRGTNCSWIILEPENPSCFQSTNFEVTEFPLRMKDGLKKTLQLYEPNPEHPAYLNAKQRNEVKTIYLDEKTLCWGSFHQPSLKGF